MSHIAVIAGATGLVGRHCLEILLADPAYGRVVALTRRSFDVQHPKLSEDEVSFDNLAAYPEIPCDVAFCALGTTIRKAGSREAFRRVDLGFVQNFALWARRSGAKTFVLVSAVGADAHAGNFYLRTKGEAEAAITAAGFESVYFLRPGLLLGERAEFRLGERIAAPLLRAAGVFLRGDLAKYRAIGARDVARAMVRSAASPEPGVHTLHNPEILARG